MRKRECIAMLLAGGQGSRLGGLTANIAKPAVVFGGKYRMIDFTLSNCTNSGIDVVGVLTQYRPLMLNSYIGTGSAWALDSVDGGVTILPVSKVTFGVATGGSDFSGKGNKDLFGGGTGAGVTVSPVAFLVVKGGNVRTIQLADANNSLERAITMLPELVDKLGELLRKEKPADPAVEYTVEQPPVEA